MPGWLIVTLVALGITGWYVIHCAVWPFAACWRCGGDGKFRSSTGKAWRRCRRCKGTGERVRVGRRIWDLTFRSRRGG